MLARPWLLWSVAAIFWCRDLLYTVLAPDRPDPRGFVAAGAMLLRDPQHLYGPAAEALRRLHALPSPGGLEGLFSPPALAWLAAPFSLLPGNLGPAAWTLLDAVAAVVGLVLLERAIRPRIPASRPLFWLAAGYFPPLFADLQAGQLGGYILALAAASIVLERRRPALAGVLAGLAATLKLYPLALLVGAGRGRVRIYAGALIATFVAVTAITFLPLGASAPALYVRQVLLPVQAIDDHDCAFDSTHNLFMRTIGGEPWLVPNPSGGLTEYRLPVDAPIPAEILAYATVAAALLLTLWAVLRTRDPVYGLCLAFALGAIVPGHVFPYQLLPLLPLALLLLVRAVEAGRVRVLVLTGLALLLFVRPPCASPLPNLWTLGALSVFALGLWQNRLLAVSTEGGVADGS